MEKDNVPINILINSISNLRGPKGEQITVLFKIDFADKTLADSEPIDLDPTIPTVDLHFGATLQCNRNDYNVLDEISHKPILVTVIEIMPKDKKGKDQTSTPLGQVTVDLLPLLRGQTHLNLLVDLHPVPGSPLDAMDAPKVEMEINVQVPESLLPGNRQNDCNLVSIGLGTLYAPPDTWRASGPPFIYTASLAMPITEEKEKTIVFANGALKTAANAAADQETGKRWSNCPNAQGDAVYIPGSGVPATCYADDRGDFRRADQQEFRAKVETTKSRVIWMTERRCHLEPGAVKVLEKKITSSRYWPVEIFKTPIPTNVKGKKNEDDQPITFHGVAYVNLSPLLYPGATYIRGAYRIYPYNEQEVYERTKRRDTIVEAAVRAASDYTVRNLNSPYVSRKPDGEMRNLRKKRPEKRPEDDADERFTVTSKNAAPIDGTPPDAAQIAGGAMATGAMGTGAMGTSLPIPILEAPEMNEPNPEGQQYLDAKSYIFLEISVANPIVPKRQKEQLSAKVADYVPPRPLFPKRIGGAAQAVEDYHRQVSSVANQLLDEFRCLYGEEVDSGDFESTHRAMEERKKKLMYELTVSGKHFAFKEQLKHSVIKIVREKFLQTKSLEDPESLHRFLSDLYVFLVDQMHKGLSKVIQVEDQPPLPTPVTDCDQLRRFAHEAEINLDFDLASRFHAERISLDKRNPRNWVDFGRFNLLVNDVGKAEECFRESVAIDPNFVPGLLLYGLLCTNSGKYEEAEDILEAATSIEPDHIVAQTVFGLFYNSIGNDILAGMAFEAANRLNNATAQSKRKLEDGKMEMDRVEILRGGDCKKDGRGSKGKGITKNKSEVRLQVDSPKSVRKQPDPAQETKVVEPVNNDNLRGNSSSKSPPEISAYLKTSFWCLEMNALSFAEMALAQELMDPNGGLSGAYHLAMARLQLQKEQFKDAEESIQEALQYSYQDPECWALLGHILFLQADYGGARDCYERTLNFVKDAEDVSAIYLRLASIYLQEEQYEKAKETYLSCCRSGASSVSWLGVGIACYRLGQLAEAEHALVEANILNNLDPAVWGYLSLVCLQTGRVLEAEQSYKYCMKLKLQDEHLLREIENLQRLKGFGNPSF